MVIYTIKEIFTFCKPQKPLLAIDYGQKKIGLAISSPDQKIAMPLKLIAGDTTEKQKLQQISDIIQKHDICIIVVGLPVNMDGTEGNQSFIVKSFSQELEKITNVPIFFQDERLTSKAADNFLKSFGLKRKQRNQYDDLTAASMILETTLESINKIQ